MNTISKTFKALQQEALETLVDFLKIPSVSSDPARKTAMAECVDFLETWLAGHDFTTRQISTSTYPALIAETGPDTGRTILFSQHRLL